MFLTKQDSAESEPKLTSVSYHQIRESPYTYGAVDPQDRENFLLQHLVVREF